MTEPIFDLKGLSPWHVQLLRLGCVALESQLRATLDHPGGNDADPDAIARCEAIIQDATRMQDWLAKVLAGDADDQATPPAQHRLN